MRSSLAFARPGGRPRPPVTCRDPATSPERVLRAVPERHLGVMPHADMAARSATRGHSRVAPRAVVRYAFVAVLWRGTIPSDRYWRLRWITIGDAVRLASTALVEKPCAWAIPLGRSSAASFHRISCCQRSA